MGFGGVTKRCIGDAIVSFLWVYLGSSLGVVAFYASPYVGISDFAILLVLVIFISIAFEFLCNALGGASFNLAVDMALFTAGVGKKDSHSLSVLAFRFPAQITGAILGVFAIDRTAPTTLRHIISGPKLQPEIDLYLGMGVELALALILNLAILWSILACPEARTYTKSAIPLFVTITLIWLGAPYTGASMNPGTAFGWAFFEERHNTAEHFLVYWVASVSGAILAAFIAGFIWRKQAAKEAAADSEEKEEKNITKKETVSEKKEKAKEKKDT